MTREEAVKVLTETNREDCRKCAEEIHNILEKFGCVLVCEVIKQLPNGAVLLQPNAKIEVVKKPFAP